MALKSIRLILRICFIAILCCGLIPTETVRALVDFPQGANLPVLDAFVGQVKNGQADELRGIYLPEILAARVVQQPAGMPAFVSSWENVVTQFSLSSKLGSTGLLAHNYLAGKSFALLQEGQEFFLIYGNGQLSRFRVTEILQYQALQPDSTSSSFVGPDNNNALTASEVFRNVYGRPGAVVFQTCIEANGNTSWGRLFIIAEPVVE